ncbi:MAG: orotidine-5'-phosphate decarboxylase [Actinomycetia bacterium]|nr:orotidine-5'-phosphate decarboxylase [Actinomycetes bacterium]
MTFAQRLADRVAQLGALCVGIDPHPAVIERWGQPYSVTGLEAVSLGMVAALADRVAAFKPQSALYEAHGSAGIAVLERTIAAAQAAGALVVLDVKRGDIGSTMEAYARAYLTDGSPLAADAVTVSPYLGFGSLRPAFDAAHASGRGVYLLARTSNPEGGEVQQAVRADGRTVVQAMVDDAAAVNEASGQNAIGLVIGATHRDPGCDLSRFTGSVLAPGVGAQGGRIADLPEIFGPAAGQVLATVSREVLLAGPEPQDLEAAVARLVTSQVS